MIGNVVERLERLLAQPSWICEDREIACLERAVAALVPIGVGATDSAELWLPSQIAEAEDEPESAPFLRSVDAAKHIELAVWIQLGPEPVGLEIVWPRGDQGWRVVHRLPNGEALVVQTPRHALEASTRTLAALKVGFMFGVWGAEASSQMAS